MEETPCRNRRSDVSDEVTPLLLEVPGHQRVDLARWPTCGDTLKRLCQPGQRVDFVHLGGLDERGQRRPSPSAACISGKKAILPNDCLGPDGTLDDVGVYLDAPVMEELFEGFPPIKGIANCFGEL